MINLNNLKQTVEKNRLFDTYGEVYEISEHLLISKGPICKIGDLCAVGEKQIPCEVIAIKKSDVFLMPLQESEEMSIKDKVFVRQNVMEIPEMEFLLGRTLNALGEFMDGIYNPLAKPKHKVQLNVKAPDPMSRKRITDVFPTGVKAIDSLLTIGEGQRIGIFAGTGVGKSTLLGMIAKNVKADVNVIALIGERGREVKEFIEKNLGEEGMKRSVVVVSTSDEQPLMNIKAAQLATSIAEEFRDQGKKVLLMMDSVTRFAIARREIDIAANRIPIGGKTPTMEPYMKKLLERAGTNEVGSITGIYTVLVEGDDMQAAIPDITRGILDGHIVLTRDLAALNHFPSIDILQSKSRVMQDIITDEHQKVANEMVKYMEIYKKNEDAIKLNAIDLEKQVDIAKSLFLYDKINAFLRQSVKDKIEFEETMKLAEEIIQSV